MLVWCKESKYKLASSVYGGIMLSVSFQQKFLAEGLFVISLTGSIYLLVFNSSISETSVLAG
jgi:hypothetical protein